MNKYVCDKDEITFFGPGCPICGDNGRELYEEEENLSPTEEWAKYEAANDWGGS